MPKVLNRRTVLRGILRTGAAIAVPLPLLDAMLDENGTAYAQTATAIKPAYVTWFFGNGVLPGKWKPAKTGKGADWALSEQLQPLAELKSYLTVISGLENKFDSAAPHPAGSAAATTGGPVKSKSAQLKSIDQIVADIIGKESDFKSLEVGVTPATPNGSENTLHSVSHTGPNAPKAPEFDPGKVFTRLFSATTGTGQQAKLAAVRGSILDTVLADGTALSQSLGAADRIRLDQHLESIRALEKRLASTNTCVAPMQPTVGRDTRSEAPPAVNTVMTELIALALACEKTRVATYMFSLPAAHVYFRHLATNMNEDFHDTICHGDAGDRNNQARVHTGVLYTMKCLNEFLQKLRATPHGATNLLDNTLVYVTSCTAWGKTHTRDEWPVLLAGKAGGKVIGDQHLNFNKENLSRVLLTIAKVLGSTQTQLGMELGLVNSELPGVHT